MYEITVAVVTFFAKLHRPGWHGNNYHRETSAHPPIGRSKWWQWWRRYLRALCAVQVRERWRGWKTQG